MTQKIKVAVESPPRTATIHIEPDSPIETEDYIVIPVRPGIEKDAVQFRGQQPPGPGPRKCWACGFTWILEEGQEDICPRCNRPNVIKEIEPTNIKYVIKEPEYLQPDFQRVLHDAEEEFKRSNDLLRPISETKLTVGDLSVATKRKRQQDLEWSQKPVNYASDVTVGDLYEPKKDNRGLDELYEGQKPNNIKPCTSESQRLQWELIKH